MAIKPTRLGHLVLRVRNVKKSKEFYGSILGLEVKEPAGDKMVFFRSNPEVDHDLAVMEIGEEASGPDSNGVGLYHFAYELGSFEELRMLTGRSWTTMSDRRLRRPRRHQGPVYIRPRRERDRALCDSPGERGAKAGVDAEGRGEGAERRGRLVCTYPML